MRRFDVRLKCHLGHRYIIEREEFPLAVSTDESACIDPIELIGKGIFGRLSAVGARQHMDDVPNLLASQNSVCSILDTFCVP
jgi:hypothetical protein